MPEDSPLFVWVSFLSLEACFFFNDYELSTPNCFRGPICKPYKPNVLHLGIPPGTCVHKSNFPVHTSLLSSSLGKDNKITAECLIVLIINLTVNKQSSDALALFVCLITHNSLYDIKSP